MKKLPNKMMAVSTFLTILTANTVAPISALASETEPTTINHTQEENQSSLSFNTEKTANVLEAVRKFAEVMNNYSRLMIHSPNVTFEGSDIPGHEDLPDKIKNNQDTSRINATYWDTELKTSLIANLTNIVHFDTIFQEYYDNLVDLAKENNKEDLKDGLMDLHSAIKEKKQGAEHLVKQLNEFHKKSITDAEMLQENRSTLLAIADDQMRELHTDHLQLMDFLQGEFKNKENPQSILDSLGTLVGQDSLKTQKANSIIEEFNQRKDKHLNIHRVALSAFASLSETNVYIPGAIEDLKYMSTQWDDLDAQYIKVIETLDKDTASDLLPILSTAKYSWDKVKTDAENVKEEITGLKLDTVNQPKQIEK